MADDESPNELSTAGSDEMFRAAVAPYSEHTGQSIGPYRLLSILGEGGFGIVWLAERREPHVQRVALKIIKPGMDSNAVIARFEQERQALAVMDHPNVAKVYDAGTTAHGRPYFVMELVQGEPITEYCDRHNLTIRQRLELFIPVCEAIQHAHTKGVIHRDIKPSNVLVTIKDETPIPKVIDFGVAKAISHTLTDKTIFTEHGQIIGTPEYMSPEQAEMGALDIDTRTDVYSLGVVLYELLTGVLPFDPKELRSKGYAEIQRIIREVDPPRPSTKLTSLASADSPALDGGGEGAGEGKISKISSAAAIADHRQTRFDALVKELRSELEWIPLKAMRKDRMERYETAKDVADDLENYLKGDPLDAGPEATSYKIKKFLSRNRRRFVPILIISLVIFASLCISLILTNRVAVEQARAETIANRSRAQLQLIETLFTHVLNEAQQIEGVAPVLRVLLSDMEFGLRGLSLSESNPNVDDQLLMARIRLRMGQVRFAIEPNAEEKSRAIADFTSAYETIKSLNQVHPGHWQIALWHGWTAYYLGWYYFKQHDPESGGPYLDEALDQAERLTKIDEARLDALQLLGFALQSRGDEAKELAEKAEGSQKDLLYQQAIEYYTKVRDVKSELLKLATNSEERVKASHNLQNAYRRLAAVYLTMERPKDARRCLREAAAMALENKNEDSKASLRDLTSSYLQLGELLAKSEDGADQKEAEASLRLSLDFAEQQLRFDPTDADSQKTMPMIRARLGRFLAEQGQRDEGCSLLEQSVDEIRLYCDGHPSDSGEQQNRTLYEGWWMQYCEN